MAELNEIYSPRILEIAGNIPPQARIGDADASATAYSKLCGSTITVDLNMKDGVVTAFGQNVKACLLGQTSAAVMAQNIIGTTAQELRQVGSEMRRMLKENGAPPAGRWRDLEVLEPVRDYKARHTSTLLVFDAVEDAISQIEQRKADGVK